MNPWLIVLGLSLGPAVSNGFTRFSYGLILPAMQEDLAWNYTQAGAINTANAIGYLIGAIVALMLTRRLGARRLFNLGMVLMVIALVGTALTRDFWLLNAWRVLAGIGGAPVFIAAGALVSNLFQDSPRHNALAIALALAGGGGVGMLLSGIAIPLLLEHWGSAGWPYTWLALGFASGIAIPISWLAVKAVPQTNPIAANQPNGPSLAFSLNGVWPALLAYFLFGVAYIIYLTFLVAWMRNNGADAWMISAAWALLSLMVIASPFVWQRLLARARAGEAMAGASAVTGIAILMVMVVPGPVGVMASAALFGSAFFIVPTAATSLSRKRFAPQHWARAVAWFTVLFALGQTLGPIAAGAIADFTGEVGTGLWVAGAVMLAGAIASMLQRAPKTDGEGR
ncbi:MAG: YbfB/YjiJ family MFS transporter [Burkholderiaceae bacterium]